MMMLSRAVLAAFIAFPLPVLAQQQVKPPVAQFWMDVATSSMSIPGMEEMDSGAGGFLSGVLGNVFGTTKFGLGMPGKYLDTALHTRNKPSGTEGTHAIPPGMAMGQSLPLIPVKPPTPGKPEKAGPSDEEEPEKPKGKLLFYWGCSETVRPGQPRVIDFAKSGPEEWARFMTGRFARDRGAKAVPGRSVWPNERDRQRVPAQALLEGEHAVTGEGVPEGLRFALKNEYDFMPKLAMNAAGDPNASVPISWQRLPTARGYFLTAMGGRGENEMVFWSSSEQPDPGWGLLDYLPPAQVTKLIQEKVVLPPSTERCAVPKGIFAGAEGAIVRMIAYGPELNLAHPPRPADPKTPWTPDWAVRVRIKSSGMAMLGQEAGGGGGRRGPSAEREAPPPKDDGAGFGTVNPLNVIKGIFGR